MRGAILLLAACIALGAAAAGADWVLVSSGTRITVGEDFDLLVIAPGGEAPPDEIALAVRADLAEIVVTLRAEGDACRKQQDRSSHRAGHADIM